MSFDSRLPLLNAGFAPIPCEGKRPPFAEWQKTQATAEQIELWSKVYPFATNTGILTRDTPAIDIDIKSPEAAEAIEELARQRFGDGHFLVRIGNAPKRAILFRTDQPFKKTKAVLTAPNGDKDNKIEILGDGQQIVAYGIHPDTGKEYTWHGGSPGEIARADLPCISGAEASAFLADAIELLTLEHGFRQPETAQPERVEGSNGGSDWGELFDNIHAGRDLHDSLCVTAAKLVRSGMGEAAAVAMLQAMTEQSEAVRDQRWQDRYRDIERAVRSAVNKYGAEKLAVELDRDSWQYDDGAKAVPQDYLIKRILPRTGAGILAGQWGTFKTLTALYLSLSVMDSIPFAGRFKVKRPGGVVYFALEGSGGIQSRLRVIANESGITRPLPFLWRGTCPPLTAPGAFNALSAEVEKARAFLQGHFGQPLVLAWFDTYAQAAGFTTEGGDNSAAINTQAMQVLRALAKQTDALVMAVDHFGKDHETGTRGSSAKEDRADVVLVCLGKKELSGEVRDTRLAVRKQRDGVTGIEIPFTPKTIETEFDEDNEPITWKVIDWSAPVSTTKAAGGAWTPALRLLRDVLAAVLADCGLRRQSFPDGPIVTACDLELVRAEFYKRHPAEGDAKQKQNARRQAFNRAVKDAQARQLIATREAEGTQWIWPTSPSGA